MIAALVASGYHAEKLNLLCMCKSEVSSQHDQSAHSMPNKRIHYVCVVELYRQLVHRALITLPPSLGQLPHSKAARGHVDVLFMHQTLQ